MKHFGIKILFVSCLISYSPNNASAQYTGGSYCGFAIISISCPAAANVFTGGSYDGFAFSAIGCPASVYSGGPWDGFSSGSIACPGAGPFLGGSYDGFAGNNIYCAVPATIFFGGSYDGFGQNSISCPASATIFFGGAYDGFALSSTSCPVPVDIFLGGSYDGFALNGVSCPATANIFLGGSYDGFAFNSLGCAATVFSGGGYDGFAMGGIACSNLFAGGAYDGFAFNNVACSAPLNVFTGGSYDGFALNNFTCVMLNVAAGGVYDGFAYYSYYSTFPCGNALPVELRSFTGNCNDNVVYFKWSTASEINNAYFTVERSTNSIDWQIIGTVDGAGNSSSTLYYTFTDDAPIPFGENGGVRYYKLKQTDYDGKFQYSDVITIENCGADKSELIIFPNPATGTFNISYNGNKEEFRSIAVFNILGEKIYYSDVYKPTLNLSDYPDGVYFVLANLTTKINTKRIVIKK